ncbi:MAG: RNB domain-containing ribonuclease [Verrucomicrobiota bacterium]|nr:RNB domain-containing ribonuclease [Verrucomicrobiota bacterium]
MSFTNSILKVLQRRGYVPSTAEALQRAIDVPGTAQEQFRADLETLLKTGVVVRTKGERYILPNEAGLVTGIIRFRQNGAAMIIPERGGESISVRPEDTHTALHGDRVVARLEHSKRPAFKADKPGGRKPSHAPEVASAQVIRIIERNRTTLTGTLQKSRLYYYIVPDDPRIVQDILVPDPQRSGLKPPPKVDDKVVVKLLEWEHRHLNPQAEYVEILGASHTPFAEYKAILHTYDLDPEFPQEVLAEVAKLPRTVQPAELVGRMDLRTKNVFTIDPDDAKDFDDALHIEPQADGGWVVGIHIADVSSYVRVGTALNKEANQRGNSTYLVGTVIPMLPHVLSNGLCSLVEAEDRLTKSVFITYSRELREVKVEFANSVIRSRKRMTYRQAMALIAENDFDKIRALPLPAAHQTGSTGRALSSLANEELASLQRDVRALWDIARKLRHRRMTQGSLDLDMPEFKIFVDKDGYADRIEKIEYDESHQLIEEFMLAANEAIARQLTREKFPCIYRVHEEPDAEKLGEYREYVAGFGLTVGDLTKKKEVTRLLAQIKAHPQGYHLRTMFLRSLKQANYRATPDGHFGLSKQDYTHFTSPIRRYADLVVHRVLQRYLEKNHLTTAALGSAEQYTQEALEQIAKHISDTERNSTDAERESQKIKLLEFFDRELAKKDKTAFEAIITDIRGHGFFIELTQSQAFGMVHVSTLPDDFYDVVDDGKILLGRRKKTQFHLGATIKVKILKIDRFKRQMDFALAETPDTAKQEVPGNIQKISFESARETKKSKRANQPQRRSDGSGPRKPKKGHKPPASAKNTPKPRGKRRR